MGENGKIYKQALKNKEDTQKGNCICKSTLNILSHQRCRNYNYNDTTTFIFKIQKTDNTMSWHELEKCGH